MLAIVNPEAGGGKALEKWIRIEARLRATVGTLSVLVTENREQLHAAMPALLARGHREFLAAGGDGTVNTVLDALVDHADANLLRRIKVGAVGLGSSNDFHKPFGTTLDGIPCRIDFDRVLSHDIGRLEYEDPQGADRARHWFVNASIGVASEANDFFNHPDRLLRFLKRLSTSIAIVYAAVAAIVTNRPRDLALTIDDQSPVHGPVRNLGVVKNPHFAGSLRYDSPHLPDSGCFHVHRLGPVTRTGLLRALARLARGHFAGSRGARTWLARQVTVRNGGGTFPVECDGEVVRATVARFSILPQKVRLCS